MSCPNCGHEPEKLQTLVDCSHAPTRADQYYDPRCKAVLFKDHNPNRPYNCNAPAVLVDGLFPVYHEHNRCEAHLNWPEKSEAFDPEI